MGKIAVLLVMFGLLSIFVVAEDNQIGVNIWYDGGLGVVAHYTRYDLFTVGLDGTLEVYFKGLNDYIYYDRLYSYDEVRFGVCVREDYSVERLLWRQNVYSEQEVYLFTNDSTVVTDSGYQARLSGGYMYATTYNVPFKTIGFEVEASADWVFGSRNYIDSQFEYRQYIPLSLNDIIAMKYGFGIAFDPNDEFDFVVGSNRTVRGYIPKYGKAGDIYALGSLEYRRFIKQPPKAFEIALFTDVGTAIDGVSNLALKNILVSVGFGLRFYVPFFDLMKIDIALPVNSARVFPRLIFGFREEF